MTRAQLAGDKVGSLGLGFCLSLTAVCGVGGKRITWGGPFLQAGFGGFSSSPAQGVRVVVPPSWACLVGSSSSRMLPGWASDLPHSCHGLLLAGLRASHESLTASNSSKQFSFRTVSCCAESKSIWECGPVRPHGQAVGFCIRVRSHIRSWRYDSSVPF